MALIPVVQNLHDEFVLYVNMIETEHTMDEICAEIIKVNIAFERNGRPDEPLRVRRVGAEEPFPRDMTAAAAGIEPMSSLEFYYEND